MTLLGLKKRHNFNVSMGAFDSAQIADLIAIYTLDILSRFLNPQNVGLYRDDGLIVIPNTNGPLTSQLQKKIIKAFKFLGFKIEISSNLKIVNFLDVTFNLNNNTYKPFQKENQSPIYTNIHLNHPKAIINQIPNTVNTRINKLSSSKTIFNQNKNQHIIKPY